MGRRNADVVLLICDREERAQDLLARLFGDGFSVIGPCPTAGLALAMAAQTAPTVALVARPPTGRRSAKDLAESLMETWGVRSWVLPEGGLPSDCDGLAQPWSPRPKQLARLRGVIGEEAQHGRA